MKACMMKLLVILIMLIKLVKNELLTTSTATRSKQGMEIVTTIFPSLVLYTEIRKQGLNQTHGVSINVRQW